MATLPADDRDLDDAALWAVIDSAAAAVSTASYSSPSLKTTAATTTTTTTTTTTNTPRFRSPLTLTHSNFRTPPSKPPHYVTSPVNNDNDFRRPSKIQRSSSSCVSEPSNLSPPPLLAHWPIKPVQPSPIIEHRVSDDKENFTHCLSGRFPTVSLFKDYQDAAMAVLDKSDYTMISGSPFIKKSGWRKIAFYFNVSFEIKDKTIEFDHNRNVQRAEFVVRAYMQGGRFSDGWGSCELREKRFMKPNNDIPSTAETRAKNKACQDLIGIGQYRHSASHSHFPSPR